jgi:hypothetical protein
MVKCGQCGFEAKSEFGLKAHIRIKHQIKDTIMPEPIQATEQVEKDDGMTYVTLKNTITINGERYSGTTKVPYVLAQDLRYRDRQVSDRLERELQTIDRVPKLLGDVR